MGVKNYISVGLGLFLVAMIFGNFVSAQVNISVGNYLVDPSTSTITVPINISNCSGIGSGDFEIYYNGFDEVGANPGFNLLNATNTLNGNFIGINSFLSPAYPVIDIQFGPSQTNGACILANIVWLIFLNP